MGCARWLHAEPLIANIGRTRCMRVADYNSISSQGYEARYQHREYQGIQQALVSLIGNVSHLEVLEVGAGTGHWLAFFAGLGCRVMGLDLSRNMLTHARETAPTAPLVQGDAVAMPFCGEAFDRLLCVNALHQFVNKPQFLVEARRVLRIGGKFMSIGLDPHTGRDAWWVYEYFPETIRLDRERYVSTDILCEEMVRAGFVNCETWEVQHIFETVSADSKRRRGHFDRSYTSQLTILSDEEYGQGLQRIERAIVATSAMGQELFLNTDIRLYATVGLAG